MLGVNNKAQSFRRRQSRVCRRTGRCLHVPSSAATFVPEQRPRHGKRLRLHLQPLTRPEDGIRDELFPGHIKGADAVLNGKAKICDGIKALDPYTLQVAAGT